MSTFTNLSNGRIIFEDGEKHSFLSSNNVLTHPADSSLILISPYASGQQSVDEGFAFDWRAVTIPSGAASRADLIQTLSEDFFGGASVQYPLPVDGDSVHAKDIDVDRSIMGNFSGLPTGFFNDLHSENTDGTSNNPKLLTFHFHRTTITPLIGFGSSEGNNFSNVKVIGILSGGIETVLADFSGNSTPRTTQFWPFPNTGLNAVRFEFHTTNSISLTNIYIPKLQAVAAILETPIKYATSYKSPYLLNAASQDMRVAGTLGTPIDFKYIITGFTSAKWIRSFIDLQDGAQNFDPADFGAIASGLTNGVQIIVVKDGVEAVMETWKTNMDVSMTMFDFSSPFKVGAYVGRWTIVSDIGSPITLFPGDEIICRIRDTLTALDAFRFRTKLSQ